MRLISITDDVFQVSIGWLKNSVLANMLLMLVTADVSQAPIELLKDQASSNIKLISVTADVFQDPMASLNHLRYGPENTPDILVTSEMSHSAMSPYLEIKRGLSLAQKTKHTKG